jgi:hypothetical protein
MRKGGISPSAFVVVAPDSDVNTSKNQGVYSSSGKDLRNHDQQALHFYRYHNLLYAHYTVIPKSDAPEWKDEKIAVFQFVMRDNGKVLQNKDVIFEVLHSSPSLQNLSIIAK